MFGLNKSQLTVIGLLLLVLAVFYGGELYSNWLYQKEQQLPRLVMRVIQPDGKEFVFAISQADYKRGQTDLETIVRDYYPDQTGHQFSETVDCLEFRKLMKRTLSVEGKNKLRAGWEYDACYPERQAPED
ncbi:hypothetical protein [Luteithermobacter gelatinilyticus]|uniref:hypothetical protein n=1 Tax=Luteithermobacter gelatinilyticus TaxID=2582913 RepID=UPI001106EF4B|nr:hypothetical protein [Luteithermobacter gelatinilyticus]|tara:strand:+ start:1439 stop:1828 length:390 start_codon:yes stop_codon:yes gene_type:complete